MKTTWRSAVLVGLVGLLLAATAQAGTENKSDAETFKLYGKVVQMDKGAGTLHIEVNAPDSLKNHSPLTVMTTSKTKFKQCEESDAPTTIDLNGVQVGRMVKITGNVKGSDYMANSVIQY